MPSLAGTEPPTVGTSPSLAGGAGGVEELMTGLVAGLADRLALRSKPWSLLGFLPSPSVASDSDVASGFFSLDSTGFLSFLPEMVSKKEDLRLSLRVSELVAGEVTAATGGAASGDVAIASVGLSDSFKDFPSTLVSFFSSFLGYQGLAAIGKNRDWLTSN